MTVIDGDLTVLVSASRSGSTALAEHLRRSGVVATLANEAGTYLRAAGYTAVADDGDLHGSPGSADRLGVLLQRELGAPADRVDRAFVRHLPTALARQWTCYAGDLAGPVPAALAEALGGAPVEPPVRWWRARFPVFIATLARRLSIPPRALPIGAYDPWFRRPPARHLGTVLGDRLVEEPPFVVPLPVRSLPGAPRLVKGPAECHRLPFWAARAGRLRVLHLTRDPRPSINGLMDGWRSAAFHSWRVPGGLAVTGYSEVVPDGRRWWKFDRPVGWAEHTTVPLVDVCAFQWQAAHGAVLAYTAGAALDEERYLRVRFEDLTAASPARERELARIAGWLDVAPARLTSQSLPFAMATNRGPHRDRWRIRAGEIRAAIARSPALVEVAERLGYARAGPPDEAGP